MTNAGVNGYPAAVAPVAPQQVIPPYASVALFSATAWITANKAAFMRFPVQVTGTYRYVNWRCDVQNGNYQVGVVALNQNDPTLFTRVAHSGVIACPSAGNIRTDIGPFTLTPGPYAAFFWADGTTLQTRYATNTGVTATRAAGTLASITGGVPGAGTITWDTVAIAINIESV